MSSFSTGIKVTTVALGFIAAAVSAGAFAQGIVNRPQISAALANELVGDTVAICAK